MDDLITISNSTFRNNECLGDHILDLHSATEGQINKYLYSSTERRIILLLYPVSLIIGLTGNIAFLVVLARLPDMRTITNFYLGNLAVADATFLSSLSYDVLIGFLLSPNLKSKPYMSSFGCGLLVTVQYTAHIASVGLILLVTLERYYGICKPLQHRMIVAKGRTLKLVITAWVVGFIFAAMVVPKYSSFKSTCIIWPKKPAYEHMPSVLKSCNPVVPFFNIFQAIVLAFPLAVVLTINMCMYFRIIRELSKRVSADKPSDDVVEAAVNTRALRIRNQVAKLLIATGTFFFFCCVPEFILRLNGVVLTLTASEMGFKMTARQRWVVVWMARGFTTINAVVNPVIYNLTNDRYREAFKKVFLCSFERVKTAHSQSTGLPMNTKTKSASEKQSVISNGNKI